MSKGKDFKKARKYIYYSLIAISLVVIGYFNLPSKPANSDMLNKSNSLIKVPAETKDTNQKQTEDNLSKDTNATPQQETDKKLVQKEKIVNKNSDQQTKLIDQSQTSLGGLMIQKNGLTSVAKIYPYQVGQTYMEVLAVKASDGSIRTALNTCQVCYDSGRGYYQQDGNYLVCQNCKNRFNIDQVGLIRGGCNPVAITDQNKKDMGQYIFISKSYLDSQRYYFSKWKS